MASTILIANTSVFLHGRIIEPGDEFTCDLQHAKRLVESGSATLKPRKVDIEPQNEAENTVNIQENSSNLMKKLDAFTVPKLKELAQKHEIQLDSDDKKAEIIKKIIESGVISNETDF